MSDATIRLEVLSTDVGANIIFIDCEQGDSISIDVGAAGKPVVTDPYLGPYTITPTIDQQIFETKNKGMTDNLTIKKIPYYETSNISGTTIYIGSDIDGD